VDGAAFDASQYLTRLMASAIVGLGAKLPLGERLFVLGGLGPSLCYTSFVGDYSKYGTVGFLLAEIGVGAFATIDYNLSADFGLYAGLSASYGIVDLGLTQNPYDLQGGLYLAPSLGVFLRK
jgi:hypothetical protein